jgi:AcrR family transcriptional regulator
LSASATLAKGERAHQTIIDAAHQLFVEQGFAATSMRQIAERSGIALGGIYNHFPNKDAIFSAVILERHPFHQIIPLLQATPGENFETFAHNAARNMVTELGRRPDFVRLLLVEIVEFEGKHVPDMFSTVFPMILPMVNKFQQQKSELRDISPIVLFRAFLGLFFSYYMTDLLLANTPLVTQNDKSLENFVDIFLHGVIAPKEKA